MSIDGLFFLLRLHKQNER